MTDFKAGDICYTPAGRRAEFIAIDPGHGMLVRLAWEQDSGEGDVEYFDHVTRVDRVFDVAPREVYDAEVKKLEARAVELRAEISKLHAEQREAQKGRQDLLTNLSRFDALKRVEDYIEGRITYFVITSYYGVSIETWETAIQKKTDRGYWSGDLKLLTLLGDTKGDLAWRLNHYGDGSGSARDVYPCTSLEQAQDKARELFAVEFAKFDPRCVHPTERLAESAEKLGMEVPTHIAEALKNDALAGAERQVEETRVKHAEALAKLAQARG